MRKINYIEIIRTSAVAIAIVREGRDSHLHKKLQQYCAIKNWINYKKGWLL